MSGDDITLCEHCDRLAETEIHHVTDWIERLCNDCYDHIFDAMAGAE